MTKFPQVSHTQFRDEHEKLHWSICISPSYFDHSSSGQHKSFRALTQDNIWIIATYTGQKIRKISLTFRCQRNVIEKHSNVKLLTHICKLYQPVKFVQNAENCVSILGKQASSISQLAAGTKLFSPGNDRMEMKSANDCNSVKYTSLEIQVQLGIAFCFS